MDKSHRWYGTGRMTGNRDQLIILLILVLCFSGLWALTGCSSGGTSGAHSKTVINSLEDTDPTAADTVTLRAALEAAAPGEKITFDESLDGETIELTIVGDENSVLAGEYMEMYFDPDAGVMITELLGYFDRDFGKSALYAHKDVVIDASNLPNGITIAWVNPKVDARVLAVYGNLTLTNVTITGGRSVAAVMDGDNPTTQTATLARGGGLAVWGLARLSDCTVHDNRCDKSADTASERDQGAFGGGIYADVVQMDNCVISGNSCIGSGVSGDGVFVVGGAEHTATVSTLDCCAVTGNLLEAGTAYGAGVYSDGGGIGERKTLRLSNCTVARNVIDGTYSPRGYWRGGGIYMSNGYMDLQGCTIVENQVSGYWREDLLGKCSLAGGVAATIGLAHAVESMTIGHCIIAGNTVEAIASEKGTYAQDIFTGSLLYFKSRGYNRIGVIDFSQMLVPVGESNWWSLCRRHYPKAGDEKVGTLSEVLHISDGTYSTVARSMGVGAGEPALLHYPPTGTAVDRIPLSTTVNETLAEYSVASGGDDDFLEIFLARVETRFNLSGFASKFADDFDEFLATHDANPEDNSEPEPDHYYDSSDPDNPKPILSVADTAFFGPAETWVKEPENYPLILFWHQFDAAIAEAVPGLGDELIGDAQWDALFDNEVLEENLFLTFKIRSVSTGAYDLLDVDQIGNARPENGLGDIGAIEIR